MLAVSFIEPFIVEGE